MRKFITALALAAALAVTTVASFASVVYDNDGDSDSVGGGNGGGTVATSTYTSGTVTPATVATGSNVTAPNGETLALESVTNSNANVTSGLVDTASNDAYAATGAAKTAGLPESVVNVINQLDNGYLGGVPGVNTTGLTAYGKTIAVRTETADRTAMLYASALPANVQVLIYNNNTGTWMLLPASVNRANNTVTYEAPAGCDGQTAIIVG